MKRINLDGLYARFSPIERIKLMIAAIARGDRAEFSKLRKSAPMVNKELPNYFGEIEGLHHVLLVQLLDLLEHAAIIWWLSFINVVTQDIDSLEAMRMASFDYIIRLESARKMCREMGVDPDLMLAHAHDFATFLVATQKRAQELAPTEDEIKARLRERGGAEPKLKTVESLTGEWWELCDRLMSYWKVTKP